ncbi:outer membrane protein [Coxiella-like endosymbiont]|uniref:outer membrane protein n=1 Tax=Coxiella-like endosymbiont TaxID=1592897 RepID=UPI00272DAB02|nr:hypothetical protein [Coxiella-like endosymbiont]
MQQRIQHGNKYKTCAINISALCCLATAAFAGRPYVPVCDMNGFHVGLGFWYNSYIWDQVSSVADATSHSLFHPTSISLTQFGSVGELGYTFATYNWIFGVRGQFQYDNIRVVQPGFLYDASLPYYRTGIGSIGSHFLATLLAGLKVNDWDAVYLEGGYTTLLGRITVLPGASAFVSQTVKEKLNGGVAAIGWRHYFMNNIFVDLRYSYSLYRSKTSSVSTTSEEFTATVNNPTRVAINGITATANYLFNI